jgi:hypothetical protein
MDFVEGLISLGRRAFCGAICSPDETLGRLGEASLFCINPIGATVDSVYEEKTGEPIPDDVKVEFGYSGRPFVLENLEELRIRAPNLWKVFGHLHE